MDTIRITIPASPAYVQVVRLTAAGLATRLGFTIDDIEDLKIGVDELAAYVTGTQGRDGEIEVAFNVGPDRIEIRGTGRFAPGQKIRTELTEFSRMILSTVADESSLAQQDGTATFSLTKTKK